MPYEPDEAQRLIRAHRRETEAIRARLGLPWHYVPFFFEGVDRWPDGTTQGELPAELREFERQRFVGRGAVVYYGLEMPISARAMLGGVRGGAIVGCRLVLES